jgi:hypothetical protein
LKVSKVKLTIIVSLVVKCLLLGLFWSEYSKNAPDPYQIWGADEAHWLNKSVLVEQAINRKGVIATLFDLPNVVSTWHCGWPFLAGVIFFMFGKNVFIVILLKQFIYAIGCIYIYKLSLLLSVSRRSSYIIFIFSIIYPPLTIYSVSFMREEVLFSLVVFNLYLITKNKFENNLFYCNLYILFTTFTICTFRVHIGCIFVILYFASIFNGNFRIKRFFLMICVLFIIIYISSEYIAYGLRMVTAHAFSFSLLEDSCSFIRFIFSPLPWKIGLDNHNAYNIWWYYLSLGFLVLSIFYFQYLLQSIINNKMLFFFIMMYFSAYIMNAKILGASNLAIGPRQFALIGPLFFMTAYSVVLEKLVFLNKSKTTYIR